jgi:hypothetical protein
VISPKPATGSLGHGRHGAPSMRRDRGRDVRPDPMHARHRPESTPDPTGGREPPRTADAGAPVGASLAAGAVRIAARTSREFRH